MTSTAPLPPQYDLTRLLDALPDPFFTVDTNGHITALNENGAALATRPRQELLTCPFTEAYGHLLDGAWARESQQALKDGQPREYETFQPVHGAWFKVRLTPLGDGLAVLLRDVTLRKHTEHLQQVTSALAGTRTMQQVTQVMLEQATQVTGADMAALYDLPLGGEYLELAGHLNCPLELQEKFQSVPITSGLPVSDAVLQRTPVFVSANFDARYPRSVGVRPSQIRSLAALPLIVCGRLNGVLVVSFRETRNFTERDQEFLLSLTQQCTQALERARSTTKEHLARETAEHREERYRSLAEATAQIVWTHSPEGHFTEDQPQWRAFTGQTPEEILGLGWFDAVHPDDRQHAQEKWKLIVEGHAEPEVEYRLRRHDGEYRFTRARGVPIRDADGSIREWVGTHKDITEQRDSEERLRATIEQAAVGIAHVHPDGRWVSVNQKLCDIVGYTKSELEQLSFQGITHPDDLDDDLTYVARLLKDEIKMYSMHKRYIRKDGTFVWANLTVSLVRGNDGEPKYFIAVVEDITDVKQAELDKAQLYQNARMNERRFRSLVEATTQMVWICSPTGELLPGQTEWQQFTGQSEEEQLGWGWLRAIHPEDCERTRQGWIHAVETQTFFQMEHRVRRNDGEYRFMRVRAVPVHNDDGTQREWVGVHEDITEHKHAQAERTKLAALVEESSDYIAIADLNWNITYLNRAGHELIGLPEGEPYGHALHYVHEDDHSRKYDEIIPQVLAEGRWQGDIRMRHQATGEPIEVNRTIFTLKDPLTAEPFGYGTIVRDVRKRKAAEEALRRSHHELANSNVALQEAHVREEVHISLAEALQTVSTPEAVAEIALGQLGPAIQARAMVMLLLAEENLYTPITWGDVPEAIRSYISRPDLRLTDMPVPLHAARTGEPVYLDNYHKAPNAIPSFPSLGCGLELIRNRMGKLLGFLVAWRDVGPWAAGPQDLLRRAAGTLGLALERAENERRLAEGASRMAELNTELTAYVMSLSRDIQDPLRRSGSFLALARRRLDHQADEKVTRYLDVVQSEGERVRKLVEDLVYLSPSGQRDLRLMDIPLTPLVVQVRSDLESVSRGRQVKWTVEDLPVVQGDMLLLRSALAQVLENALKFTRECPEARIDVGALEREDEVVLWVRDNGVGFPQEHAGQVFELFTRLHEGYEGSGLGLTNARRIIHRHGGRVWAQGTPGEGATFFLALPRTSTGS